ncbi:hypothetical protein KJ359_007746 [Pestalotiopsis sp. 9143b]|nr:hypothetical protein KJ359_007746 [Pestalotiopsis sp. 9143b]
MARFPLTKTLAVASLLLGFMTTSALALIAGDPRPVKALPERATPEQLMYQPYLDFDKNGCYNALAIDAQGNLNPGMGHNNVKAGDWCRQPYYLEDNNVYVRTICNEEQGWCGYLYSYYFEKDVGIERVIDAAGHTHDWEAIVVFVHNGDLKRITLSVEGGWRTYYDDQFPSYNGTHPKVVYHKAGGLTHSFRPARLEEVPENHSGLWFAGALVDYDTGFPPGIREKLENADWGNLRVPFNLPLDVWLDKPREWLPGMSGN